MVKHKSFGDRLFVIINTTLLTLLGLVFFYPMVYQLAISLSSAQAVSAHKVFLWPVDISLASYEQVFETGKVTRAYGNTIYYTVLGTIFQLIGTTFLAYPLSKKRLVGRRTLSFLFYFTNIFNGGLIPTFLVVKNLGMIDTVWALVVPGCISVYYGIILRTNFESIPSDLEEAAKIDGLGNWGILLRIYIPLSKAIYAALALFFAVGFWNSYVQPLIYLNDDTKYTLQMILRNIVLQGQMTDIGAGGMNEMDLGTNTDTLKAACIMVVMLPVMCIYPFIQKYFVKGIMIGAVKG
ncbi:MAG: carbohydrate ABC transporter permease [Firmicutes bacterium]|nr:carbohydrate ABC transporter permease [Bacillota bacterium]